MDKNKIGIICCILMMVLLLGTVFFFTLLPKDTVEDEGLTYDGLSQNHPSGYKVHEWEPDLDKVYVIVEADSVINDWYEDISYKQYQEFGSLFSKDKWQKIDDMNYDEQDASIIIRIEYPPKGSKSEFANRKDENIFIYADDKVSVFSTDSDYQMPAGTCENINAYLQQYYQKQHDITVNLDTFLPDFFATEYEVYWHHDYGKVLYKQYDELDISSDDMFCPGSAEMSEELLAVLDNRKQWEEIPYDMNLLVGLYPPRPISFQCDSLYGDDFRIEFRELDNGKTHVAVNTYTAFLAPKNIYHKVEKILNHYEDQWEVIPLVE